MNDLHDLVRRVAAGDESAQAPFEQALRQFTELAALKSMAEEFTTSYEVVVPLYERVLELDPDDTSARTQLGFVHWLFGEDERARAELEQARSKAPGDVEVLLLEAALEPEKSRQEQLYHEVLRIDPQNRIARQNLGMPNE